MFCHGYRSVPYSVIFREASSCRRWEQTQRPTAKQCVESKTAENTQLKFGCLHPIPLLRTQATSQNTMLTSVPPTHRGNSLESCGLCSYLVNIPFLSGNRHNESYTPPHNLISGSCGKCISFNLKSGSTPSWRI